MAVLTATQLPQQFVIQGFSDILQPILDELIRMEKQMAALDDKITQQTAAIAANTATTNAAVAALAAGTVTPEQLAALDTNTAAVAANTAALDAAVGPSQP